MRTIFFFALLTVGCVGKADVAGLGDDTAALDGDTAAVGGDTADTAGSETSSEIEFARARFTRGSADDTAETGETAEAPCDGIVATPTVVSAIAAVAGQTFEIALEGCATEIAGYGSGTKSSGGRWEAAWAELPAAVDGSAVAVLAFSGSGSGEGWLYPTIETAQGDLAVEVHFR